MARAIVTLFIAVLFLPCLRAKADPAAATANLPDSAAAAVSPRIINRFNAAEFRVLLIPELYPLVREGTFVFEALRNLRYVCELPGVQEIPPAAEGYALKSLTFSQEILQRLSLSRLSYRLISFSDESPEPQRVVRGSYMRMNPRSFDPADKTTQIFRELISVSSPEFLKPLRWLTFRFSGAEEDFFWIASPATRKVRQLTGFNRADGLLKTALSPEDIFTWSGKAEHAEVRQLESVVALTPFADVDPGRATARGGCREIADNVQLLPGTEDSQRWNYAAQKFPQGAPWLPATTVFVPRTLTVLELTPRDPWALYGRQLVYLDAATLLPVYKAVYQRGGKLRKVVFTAWGLAHASGMNESLPYPAFTLSYDLLSGAAAVFEVVKSEYCSAFPEGLSMQDFDPRNLLPEEEKKVPMQAEHAAG